MSSVLLLALVVLQSPAISASPESQPAPKLGPHTHTIDGSEHPELIPAELAWETAFRNLWAAATHPGDQPTDRGIAALSKYELKIPVDDVRKVVQVTKAVLAKLHELRRDFEREHTSGISLGWTPAERKARQLLIGETIIDGRDELVYRLPPAAFRAVKRWVQRSIVPGIKVDIYEK
jgi:hypothetical protein